MNDLQCQMYYGGTQCNGTLIYLDRYKTCVGTIDGVECNQIAEIFVCSVCKEVLIRPYRWHTANKHDKHELRSLIDGKDDVMNYSVLLTEDELLLLDGHASQRIQSLINIIKAAKMCPVCGGDGAYPTALYTCESCRGTGKNLGEKRV